MAKISKLMLVRKVASKSTLLDRMGATKFLKGDPLNISPKTWSDEEGLSHYGFILQDLSLKDLQGLEKWAKENDPNGAITFHAYDPETGHVDTLASVGLRINESAE